MAPRPRLRRRLALVAALFGFLVAGGLIAWRHAEITRTVALSLAQRDVGSLFGRPRLNFVVLGVQEDEGNSDTILLAHLDLTHRLVTVVSIPRDTWVAIPGHGNGKINSAYGIGGPNLTARLVSRLTGAPIDGTVVVDPTGAKQLVDAMGGLNVDVDEDMNYDDNEGDLHIHLKKGEQFLTGGQVLEYIRFRHDIASDWGRMHRQQQVLHDIVSQLGAPQNWAKLPRLLALARRDVKTALSDDQLRALVELYRGVPPDDVRTFTLPARAGTVGDASVVFVDGRWARLVGDVLCARDDPPQNAVLIVNATGIPDVTRTIVGALRGGGWNVQTSVDEPTHARSELRGSDPAARRLAADLPAVPLVPAKATMLRLGADLRPEG